MPGPAGELAAWADECAAAVVRGDPGAAERLVSAESWLDMLGFAGGDPELAEFLAAFAADDRAMAQLTSAS